MAVGETLLRATGAESLPILHLWRWAAPALSIGYSQSVARFDLERLGAAGGRLVRRPTGGKAVLHLRDVSYSLVVPVGYRDWARGMRPPYLFVEAAIRLAFQRGGRPCLQPGPEPTIHAGSLACSDDVYPYELMAGGRKVLGSAQKRTRAGILVQGTIAPRGPVNLAPILAGAVGPVGPLALERPVGPPGLADIAAAFAEVHGLAFEPYVPEDEVEAGKYADPGWNLGRISR